MPKVKKKSELEATMELHLRSERIPFVPEYRFHPTRKWRFDFAIPHLKIAIECEGGVYSGGRHTRGKGFEEDCVKYNEAIVLGWDVVRFSSGMIKSGKAIDTIKLLVRTKYKVA